MNDHVIYCVSLYDPETGAYTSTFDYQARNVREAWAIVEALIKFDPAHSYGCPETAKARAERQAQEVFCS